MRKRAFLFTPAEKLRDEIISSQNTGRDYLKLKLIAVSAITSAAFGLGKEMNGGCAYRDLLCLIPFVCAFCDLLAKHIELKIKTIAVFLHRSGDPYEVFVWMIREHKAFYLEASATWLSSMLLGALVALYGWGGEDGKVCTRTVYIGLGLAGVFCSWGIKGYAEWKGRKLDALRPRGRRA